MLGLSLCILFTVCFADDHEKRAKIHKFLKCVACAAPDSDIRTEYKTCAAHKPPRFVKMLKECCLETMPDATDENAVWKKICDDESVLDKMHECVKEKKGDSEPSDEEKQQFKKYKECATEINNKCH